MFRAVMIACGQRYEEIAALTQPFAQQALGIPVEVITLGIPHVLKLTVASKSANDVCTIVIDADVVLHSWDWDWLDLTKVNATPLRSALFESFNRDVLPEGPIVHTGLMAIPGHLSSVGVEAANLMQNELRGRPHNFFDEVPMSVACWRTGTPVHWLPNEALHLNVHTRKAVQGQNVHFIGPNKLRRIQAHIQQHQAERT